MTTRTTLVTTSLIAASLISGAANATLMGRDLNGSVGSFEAYYDTDLDITWLADANYAQTSGYDADGKMTWDAATTWVAQLEINGYADWRLPTTTDTGAPGCTAFANSGTDCGYNVDTASSEMAHLYFVTLGNQSYYTTGGVESGTYFGGVNSFSTLDSVGSFINFQSDNYWSGTAYAPDTNYAWSFATDGGTQLNSIKTLSAYALAVSPGDVAAANNNTVPEPQTLALVGLGLLGLAVARRRG